MIISFKISIIYKKNSQFAFSSKTMFVFKLLKKKYQKIFQSYFFISNISLKPFLIERKCYHW